MVFKDCKMTSLLKMKYKSSSIGGTYTIKLGGQYKSFFHMKYIDFEGEKLKNKMKFMF